MIDLGVMAFDRKKCGKGSYRGRFEIARCDGASGWQLIDWKWTGVIEFDTKQLARDWKSFAIEYVRRWGDINFFRMPNDLDDHPVAPEPSDTIWPDQSEAPTWNGPSA